MPDLVRLSYFVAVAEELSFTRAAARLYLARPPLSRRIAELERDLRTPLFIRDRRHVELTAAGAALLPRARRLLADAEALRSDTSAHDADQLTTGLPGSVLRIGLFLGGIAAAELTGPLVDAARRMSPALAVEVIDLDIMTFEPAIGTRVDVGIGRLPVTRDDLELVPLFTEPRIALLPPLHPASGAESVAPEDLYGGRWFAADPMLPPSFRDYYELGDVWDVTDLDRSSPAPRTAADMFQAIAHGTTVVTGMCMDRWYGPTGAPSAVLSGVDGAVSAVMHRSGDERPAVAAFVRHATAVATRLIDLVPDATGVSGT